MKLDAAAEIKQLQNKVVIAEERARALNEQYLSSLTERIEAKDKVGKDKPSYKIIEGFSKDNIVNSIYLLGQNDHNNDGLSEVGARKRKSFNNGNGFLPPATHNIYSSPIRETQLSSNQDRKSLPFRTRPSRSPQGQRRDFGQGELHNPSPKPVLRSTLNDSSSSLIYTDEEKPKIRHRLLSPNQGTTYGEQYIAATSHLYTQPKPIRYLEDPQASLPSSGFSSNHPAPPTRTLAQTPVQQASSSLLKADNFLATFNRKIQAMTPNHSTAN